VRSGGHADICELPFEMVAGQHSWMSNHYWGIVADGEAEIRKAVRLMLREGADQIKFWASGGGYHTVDSLHDTHYTLEECKVIAEESRLVNNIPMVSHAESLESIRNSIEVNVHSIEHGDELNEECAELMARKNIYFVPTINLVANWFITRFGDKKIEATPISVEYGPFRTVETMKEEKVDGVKVRDEMYAMFKMALDKGVKIALGSDTVRDMTTKYGEYTIRELIAMVEAGMTPLEGIKAATQTAAEVLKLDKYIGTIEPGKIADIVVLKANPLDSLDVLMDKSNIKYVIQDGYIKVEDGMMQNFGNRWED
jgi:imidazolonepropionase-like amidohydrolase